ncbi:ATP-dependent RNA helicase HrpB [Vibrio aerogenes CECT 7868]|uniref:ATP-dependent RNA helicase HrpB n=1 Tax=Vibrio aerogenes CECT 7868 TaxID=1216006 RepID=A0A1M5YBW1_9VIBR|nr:ATP-dependent helicase HrpB [Vibrio aerogenes]SHI09344.1 ATP-dependent RNA helicase HrpB [Vibrio aerogenes CECT 7868]
MSQLPVEAVIDELLSAIQMSPQVILKAATGAGKSTFFPLFLLKSGLISGKIILLEPRRLAAKNIAQYVSSQLGENVGKSVGYRIRGESRVSSQTKLEIVTEGVLTRMIQSDPELSGISLILFDEFHERNLHADVALTLCLEVQDALREDLKLVVMSATLDPDALKHVLPDARFIESAGRTFPVEYRYEPPGQNELMACVVSRTIQRVIQHEHGSVLVFLPGIRMIKQVIQQLENLPESVEVCPLYGQLDFSQQQKAIQPPPEGRRKVVLATNIAETSLTIESIRIVIDSGLERIARFDPVIGVTRLEQSRISQSSAIQRAGRAGRVSEGICIRLYSESQLQQQPQLTVPEIMRTDLSALAVDLALWGVRNTQILKWMTPPPQAMLAQGRGLLQQLGVMDETLMLTGMGQQAWQLGVDIRLAAMLLKVQALNTGPFYPEYAPGVFLNTAIAGAVLAEESVSGPVSLEYLCYQWQSGHHPAKSRLNDRAQQLSSRLRHSFSLSDIREPVLGVVLGLAFPDRIAQQRQGNENGHYLLASGHGAVLPEEESLAGADYLVMTDLMKYAAGNSQIRKAARFDIGMFAVLFPEMICQEDYVDWDDVKGKLIAQSRWSVGKLIIKTEALPEPDAKEMTQALLNYVRRKGLQVLQWNEEATAWLSRVRCAAAWLPEEAWPDMDDECLLSEVRDWLSPYLNGISSVKGLKKVPLLDALKSRLGWELTQSLDRWLPVYHQLPTGQRKKIRYQSGKAPVLSVRIQEMYGEKETPVIAKGKKRLVLELLSPAQRPVQITQDLAAFWQGSYAEVRKEMKGRYPKHIWPEDPASHIATTKTKRQLNQ